MNPHELNPHELIPHQGPQAKQWLRRGNAVDLLEIYHARQVRLQICQQIARLAEAPPWPRTDGLCAGELGVFYETLLMNVDHLLDALGDGNAVAQQR